VAGREETPVAKREKRKEEDLEINDDPRPKDTVAWNRLKLMVMDEACDRAWGCALYRMHRNGLIDTEQREAGDRYWKLPDEYKKVQDIDPDDVIPESRVAVTNRIARKKKRMAEVRGLLGMGRGLLDSLVIEDLYPSTERQKVFLRAMLQQLAIFFKTGRRKL
jgi:hypothetical protein